MIELGEIQTLEVTSLAPVGVYLNTEKKEQDNILLPRKQVPEGTELGSKIEVFVYKDSEDRFIATTSKPKVTLGEVAFLEVVADTKIGAFLDWGLEKDLLLPFKEQTTKVVVGQKYLVSLYIDKSDRLCATMDVYNKLRSDSPYKQNDEVTGTICDYNKEMGAFVAIDNKFHGLVPLNELFQNYKIGDQISGRVTRVREDGRLYLSLRKKAYLEMDKDAELILEKIIQNNGILHLNDKSNPETIKKELNMSKKAFKRAVGRLLKNQKIKIKDNSIELV